MRFITTKKEQYKYEQEVRALLWVPDEYAGINRHFDANNKAYPRPLTPPPARIPEFQRHKVTLQSLITGVVVSPYSTDFMLTEVERSLRESGQSIQVRPSELMQYRHLLP